MKTHAGRAPSFAGKAKQRCNKVVRENGLTERRQAPSSVYQSYPWPSVPTDPSNGALKVALYAYGACQACHLRHRAQCCVDDKVLKKKVVGPSTAFVR